MRWMILGGGGCFGTHLAKHLLGQGQKVMAIGRSPLPSRAWTLGITDNANFQYRNCHIVRDPDTLRWMMENWEPAVIVNFAALAYATSWKGAYHYYDTNVTAVARMAEYLSGKHWLKRFVQIGSSEIYGSTSYPASEDTAPHPSSPYAVSKLAADYHVLASPRLPGVVVRPCNCYGEAQLLYRIIPRAIWSALTGHKMPLQGGGQAVKTWMHAQDLARAIEFIVEYGGTHQVYNVGTATPRSNMELMEIVSAQTGVPLENFIETAPPREGEDAIYRLNSSKIMALGWGPQIHIEPGIGRVVKWTRDNLDELGEPQDFVLRP